MAAAAAPVSRREAWLAPTALPFAAGDFVAVLYPAKSRATVYIAVVGEILDQGREYGELSLALRHLQEHSLGLPYAGVEGSHVWEEQQRFWPFIHRIDAPDLHTLRGESDQVYMLSYAVQVMLANLVKHCKVVDC